MEVVVKVKKLTARLNRLKSLQRMLDLTNSTMGSWVKNTLTINPFKKSYFFFVYVKALGSSEKTQINITVY